MYLYIYIQKERQTDRKKERKNTISTSATPPGRNRSHSAGGLCLPLNRFDSEKKQRNLQSLPWHNRGALDHWKQCPECEHLQEESRPYTSTYHINLCIYIYTSIRHVIWYIISKYAVLHTHLNYITIRICIFIHMQRCVDLKLGRAGAAIETSVFISPSEIPRSTSRGEFQETEGFQKKILHPRVYRVDVYYHVLSTYHFNSPSSQAGNTYVSYWYLLDLQHLTISTVRSWTGRVGAIILYLLLDLGRWMSVYQLFLSSLPHQDFWPIPKWDYNNDSIYIFSFLGNGTWKTHSRIRVILKKQAEKNRLASFQSARCKVFWKNSTSISAAAQTAAARTTKGHSIRARSQLFGFGR